MNQLNLIKNKIDEAKGQLSIEGQRHIDMAPNLMMGLITYKDIIHDRFAYKDTDEADINIIDNILNLIRFLTHIILDSTEDNHIEIDLD